MAVKRASALVALMCRVVAEARKGELGSSLLANEAIRTDKVRAARAIREVQALCWTKSAREYVDVRDVTDLMSLAGRVGLRMPHLDPKDIATTLIAAERHAYRLHAIYERRCDVPDSMVDLSSENSDEERAENWLKDELPKLGFKTVYFQGDPRGCPVQLEFDAVASPDSYSFSYFLG